MNKPKHRRLCRVRVRMCSRHCRDCPRSGHEFTAPLDATRIDENHVRITQPDPVWSGAVLHKNDFVFYEEECCDRARVR